MDVVSLAQQGVANAVATLGTATTSEHIQKLLRASDKIIFSFDGDAAGRKAAWRALQIGLPLLRDDVSIRFLFLPPEHDPDSYVRELGAAAFRATASEAIPLSRFMVDELASRHAMDEAEGRAACVYEAKPLLALLPETTLRIQIEHEFAKRVRLTPEELAQMLMAAPAPKLARQASGAVNEESPGLMDRPDFGPDRDEAFSSSLAPNSTGGRGRPRVLRRTKSRAVTPMAKRLLRLLLAHPELVANLGDQQLEILERSPHLVLVKDLIALANASGARHVGALLQAADPDSDLAGVLGGLTTELLNLEDLPDPQAEWDDALRRIELDAIKAEQSALIEGGLKDDISRKRYQDLTRRITLLGSAPSR